MPISTALPCRPNQPIPGWLQDHRAQPRFRPHGVPERESLERLAAWRGLALPLTSARHVRKRCREVLLQHYPPETPVALGYRVSWPDQWLQLVPLRRCYHQRERNDPTTLTVSAGACSPHPGRSSSYSAITTIVFRRRTTGWLL